MNVTILGYGTVFGKLNTWLISNGFSPENTIWIVPLIGCVVVFVVMASLSKLLNWALTSSFKRFSKRTVTHFDDRVVDNRVPRYVARVIPLILAYNLIPLIFSDFPEIIPFVKRVFAFSFIVLFVRIIRAVLRAGRDTLHDSPSYRDKPLDSYVQVAMLVLYFVAGILMFSLLTGRSVLTFLTAMGAASAVLLLIFRDTILGFVASIQISTNDMLRVGDWITMPKFGADGDVIEINLTTVKVANWDMTITTIPTYALIADSFQNWRGMQESGGRRIKRSILIKINSIRYLDEAEIKELERIQLLKPYIEEMREELRVYNAANNVDNSVMVNGRNLTNVGLFRKYVDLYLEHHDQIHRNMTRMVRQQPPNELGLPIELYCFTKTTKWEAYEIIMADIFDHLLASTKYFHVVVFEKPAADDMRNMGKP